MPEQERDELIAVRNAVQSLSNAIRTDQGYDAAVVPSALVVWEEILFDTDGYQLHRLQYATVGSPTMAAAVGLANAGVLMVERDVMGDGGDDDD